MSSSFYRILNKQTNKFVSVRGEKVWYLSEFSKINYIIKYRVSSGNYKITDFLVIKYELDSIPLKYYCLNGILTPYENIKELIETLYD